MSSIVEVRKTYKYRLYASPHAHRLHDQINIAGLIWNHITALQKRYFRRFGKHVSEKRIKQHIAYLRMKTKRYRFWRKLGSQAVQEICERHEAAYQRFFNKQGGLPRFKKVKKFRSFVLKQTGWKLGGDTHQRGSAKQPTWTGHITINGTGYKFVKHRPMTGAIKTVTIKRDAAGQLWVCFAVVEKMTIEDKASTGHIGGFDFGLLTFLTSDSGQAIANPQFFRQDLPRMRQIQRRVSKKVQGSTNRREGLQHIARRHIRIADKRRDFHYQLAHELCDEYDFLVFEDLNIAGMKRLWGRKVSDLGFAQFMDVMAWVAYKRGKQLILIDRWERTTGICSRCQHHQDVELDERIFCCKRCGFELDRDHNAAINIRELGHQLMLSQSEEDRCEQHGIRR